MGDTKTNEREFSSRRYLDRQTDPPSWVDGELPTVSVQLRGALRKASERAPHGTAIGSLRLAGTFQQDSKGTYSLRVTRVSVFSGSRENLWYVRHSRKGTIDTIYFPTPGQETRLGGPLAPVYAFGPGTVTWGFTAAGSAYWQGQSLEGYLG